MQKRAAIFRRETFSAAHRLYNPEWSDEKNFEVFGKCSRKNYHGHNYTIIVKLVGVIDKDTGFVYDASALGRLIKSEILDRFDHMNLNLDCPEFKNLNPTAENMCLVFHDILRPKIPEHLDIFVTVCETEKNSAQYPVE